MSVVVLAMSLPSRLLRPVGVRLPFACVGAPVWVRLCGFACVGSPEGVATIVNRGVQIILYMIV